MLPLQRERAQEARARQRLLRRHDVRDRVPRMLPACRHTLPQSALTVASRPSLERASSVRSTAHDATCRPDRSRCVMSSNLVARDLSYS
jgi:hypothetical protein